MKKLFILIFSTVFLFGAQTTKQNKNSYKRIISLYPAHAEIITALGAKDKLIGVSYDKKLHNEYKNINLFTYYDNAEKFIAAKPDLILIRPMIEKKFKGLIKILNAQGIKVISLQPSLFKELPDYWLKLGKLINKEKEAKNYINSFKNELKKLEDIYTQIKKEDKKSIFFETRHKNFLTTVPNTIAYTAIEKIGAINIASDAKAVRKGSTVASYKLEKILSKANDIDFFIFQKGAMNKIKIDEIYKTPAFGAIKAIKNKQVYSIDEDIISRPTKRVILGMKELGRIIYPKYFK